MPILMQYYSLSLTILLLATFLYPNALQAQKTNYYTYNLPLEQTIYEDKGYYVYKYDTTNLSNAERAIFEQIDDQIELVSGDTSLIQLSYCDIVGIKAKKDNPITAAQLPKIHYNAQYKTDYLKGYLVNAKPSPKGSACRSTYLKFVNNKVEYVLLTPDKTQLQPLNLEAGTTLNIGEKWLVPPHYDTQSRPTILEQHFKPIVVESATLSTQQIEQLLKKHSPKWEQQTKPPIVARIACFLHDKGYYNGPPILEKELRTAILRFTHEHQLPFCGGFGGTSISELTNLMQKEGY